MIFFYDADGNFHDRLSKIRYTKQLLHLLTYLLTPWSRVLLEKLTSKLCS